jgi:ribosomal protein L21E
MAGLGIQKRGTGIARVGLAKGSLPDLTGDGKITRADVLKGRGVFKKGGMNKSQKKVGKVMKEFKSGKLHSGKKGPVVKSRKQAIAIALSEAGMSKKK